MLLLPGIMVMLVYCIQPVLSRVFSPSWFISAWQDEPNVRVTILEEFGRLTRRISSLRYQASDH